MGARPIAVVDNCLQGGGDDGRDRAVARRRPRDGWRHRRVDRLDGFRDVDADLPADANGAELPAGPDASPHRPGVQFEEEGKLFHREELVAPRLEGELPDDAGFSRTHAATNPRPGP